MKKRLFVTDLDGTLLNTKKEITPYTKKSIQKIVENGDYFTVASARTPATVVSMLSGIPVNAPAVLMNGVLLFDLKKQSALRVEYIPNHAALQVVQAFEAHRRYGFLYHFDRNEIEVHYRNLNTLCEQEFYTIRKGKAYKKFVQTEDFYPLIDGRVVYFAVIGGYEELKPLSESIAEIQEVEFVFYKDVYAQDVYYLEIYSAKANKENGIRNLKDLIPCSRVIAFGDNYNDMGMFRCADECYAVENSVPELKQMADAVIPSNEDEGVAQKLTEFLTENLG